MVNRQQANVTLLLAIGGISAGLLFVIIVGLEAWFHSESRQEVTRKNAAAVNPRLVELTQRQQANLEGKTGGMPIDQAIIEFVRQQQRQRSAAN